MSFMPKFVLATALTVAGFSSAFAETIEVQMYNKNPENAKERMVFVPAFFTAKPGDTIKWISVEKGHNTVSVKGMLPDGAEEWKSKISQDFEITVEKPGVYGYACTPHEALGMVGLFVVEGEGMLDNLEAVKGAKMKGKSKKVFQDLIAQAEALKK